MPGNADLDPTKLVDALVPTVDSLRDQLHTSFGVRPFRVYTVRRSYSGDLEGLGEPVETVVELTPQPKVWQWDGMRWELATCGVDELGEVRLTEISLTYTEAELTGRPLERGEQWFFRLEDAHGQGMEPRYFAPTRPPFPDREKTIGWVVQLRKVEG